MLSDEEIVGLYREREKNLAAAHARMADVLLVYEGNKPIPGIDGPEKAAVANLLNQGVDELSRRSASTMPDVHYPPLKPGQDKSENYADIKRRANLSWWERNHMDLLLSKRFRWLYAFAMSPVCLWPDKELNCARWDLRNPMRSFPAPSDDVVNLHPSDCVFTFAQPLSWLRRNYPSQIAALNVGDAKLDKKFTILQYVSAEQLTMIVLGVEDSYGPMGSGRKWVQLSSTPNKAKVSPVIIASALSLGDPLGTFDGIIGKYTYQAMLMALELIAVKKGIAPQVWFSSPEGGSEPKIIQRPDALQGIPGIVRGGKPDVVQINPGYATLGAVDRLEGYQRAEAGIPAQWGGEMPTGTRTGRASDGLVSAAIDFKIGEAQKIVKATMEVENSVAAEIEKAWLPGAKSFHIDWKGAQGYVDYDPAKHFANTTNEVSFPAAGVDLGGLVIEAGQRVQMGTLSKEDFMLIDPLVRDPDRTRNRVIVEALEQSQLASLQNSVSTGAMTDDDIARVTELVQEEGLPLYKAVQQVHKEAQARQATVVPQGAPEAQPGIGLPGAGAESPTQAQPAMDRVAAMTQALSNFRRGQRVTPQEQQAVA